MKQPQLELPISAPSKQAVRSYVRWKLHGFEFRQAARQQRRDQDRELRQQQHQEEAAREERVREKIRSVRALNGGQP